MPTRRKTSEEISSAESLEKTREEYLAQKEEFKKLKKKLRDLANQLRAEDKSAPLDKELNFVFQPALQKNQPDILNDVMKGNKIVIEEMKKMADKLESNLAAPVKPSRPDFKEAQAQVRKAVAWLKKETERVKKGESAGEIPAWVSDLLSEENKNLLTPSEWTDVHWEKDELEQAKRGLAEKGIDQKAKSAKGKLHLAHQWLDRFEENLDNLDFNLDLLKQKWALITSEPNEVFQAQKYITDNQLETNDQVKPENNRLAERLGAIQKRLDSREQEAMKKELAADLKRLEIFLADLGARPPQENLATVEQREIVWQNLKNKTEVILNKVPARTEVIHEAQTQLLEINNLVKNKIPRALAEAALGISREAVLKREQELNSVNTLEEFLQKIKEYKAGLEKIDLTLPPDELIRDEDVEKWLGILTHQAFGAAEKAQEYLSKNKLVYEKNKVLIKDHPDFKGNVENLEKEVAQLRKLIAEKNNLLVEAKHRARVKEAVTSEAVQKGEAKLAGMFPGGGEGRLIDINEIKKNEIWGQVLGVLLREHTYFGREKAGVEQLVRQSEQAMTEEITRQFGPESSYQLTVEQCEDLFYAAKSWIYDRASHETVGESRQAMPEVAREGGAKAEALAKEAKEKAPSLKKSWGKIILKSLGWAGLGFGAVAAAPWLGFSALAGVCAVGGLRMVDNIYHSVVQQRQFNRWKKTKETDEDFKNALAEHLSFTVANLRENNLRQREMEQGFTSQYNVYYQNIHQYLEQENSSRERPLSAAELDKTAAAYAVFYRTDDTIERERVGSELNRSPNARRWWEYIDLSLGQAIRGGRLGKGWQVSSPSRRMFSGSAWLGVSLGLCAARELPGLRWAARGLAGWRLGGAAVDWMAGKKSPENAIENQLTQMEGRLGEISGMNLPDLGKLLQDLTECRAVLNSVSNPVEYARQKERLKKVLMATLAEKILKEESAYELTGARALKEKGAEIAGEAERIYVSRRQAQEAKERRWELYRMAGRLGGAVAVAIGGYALEEWLRSLKYEKPPVEPGGGKDGGGKTGETELPARRIDTESVLVEERPPESPEKVGLGEISANAVVHKGEGVEHALRRQLEADPEKWGFTGKPGGLHRWAGHEAHRLAIQFDYVKGGGLETRVRPWDKIAYLLEQDANGQPTLKEILVHKGEGGIFMPEEGQAAKAPGATDWYEYSYKKPVTPAPEKTLERPEEWEIKKGASPEYWRQHLEDLKIKYAEDYGAGGLKVPPEGASLDEVQRAYENWFNYRVEHGLPRPEELTGVEAVTAASSAEEAARLATGARAEDTLRRGVGSWTERAASPVKPAMPEAGTEETTQATLADLDYTEELAKQYIDPRLSFNNRLNALKEMLPARDKLTYQEVNYWQKGNEVWYKVPGAPEGPVDAKSIDPLTEFHQLAGKPSSTTDEIKKVLEELKKIREK